MKRTVVLALLTFVGLMIEHAAGAVAFPGKGGDIGSTGANGWNGEIPTGQIVSFANNGTYSNSTDVSFARFGVTATKATFDFSVGDHQVTLTEGSDYDFQATYGSQKLEFIKGTFNFSKNGRFLMSSGTSARSNSLTFNGTKILGLPIIASVGFSGSNRNTLRLINGASGRANDFYVSHQGGYTNRLEVTGGGTLYAVNFWSDKMGSRDAKDSSHVFVDGNGSKISIGGTYYSGAVHDNNEAVFTNGAALACASIFQFGNNSATATTGNRLEFRDGATFDAATLNLGVGSFGNVFLLDDATARLTYQLTFGNADASGNTVIAQGTKALLTTPKFRVGQNAGSTDGVALVRNGATVQVSETTTIGSQAARSSLVVSDAAFSASTLNVGENDAATDGSVRVTGADASMTAGIVTVGASENVVSVEDGATFASTRTFLNGHDNLLMISNALYRTTADMTNAVCVGGSNDADPSVVYGNEVWVSGASPKLRFDAYNGGMRFWNSSTLKFILPATPYAETPIETYQLDMDATSEIVFDLSALEGVQHGRLVYRLVSVYGTYLRAMTNAQVIEKANAALGGKGRLAWNGTHLELTVKGNQGLLLLVR